MIRIEITEVHEKHRCEPENECPPTQAEFLILEKHRDLVLKIVHDFRPLNEFIRRPENRPYATELIERLDARRL